MTVKERREREKLETREKILDAARELFLTEGYDGVSMRQVAERIEYSPTAIYVHFADKDELFRELVHADFARLAGVFQDAANLSDPVERIKRIGSAYIEFGRRFPNHYRLMFMTACPLSGPDEIDCQIKGNPEVDAYAFLKYSVQQAIDAGVFRAELTDAELLSQTLWAAVHGVISLNIAKHSDAWVAWRPLEQRAQLTLDAILRGLLKERS
jgi:AcrR family transcriptional regulator